MIHEKIELHVPGLASALTSALTSGLASAFTSAEDFLKLSIIRNPDPGTQEAFLKQDAAQTEKHCKKLIGELESQLGTGKAEATCGKVENNGVAALATQMTIPAQDNRPELINMTWTYPNGDKGVRSGGGWGFLCFVGKGCMPWRENGHGHVFRKKKNASVSV